MKDSTVYLDDILEAIDRIGQYINEMTLKEFDRDNAIQDAVVRRLEIIGEAVKHLPAAVTKSQPQVPWKQIAGMRDILIHEYAGVSVQTVWKTVTENLEPLEKAILAIKNLKY